MGARFADEEPPKEPPITVLTTGSTEPPKEPPSEPSSGPAEPPKVETAPEVAGTAVATAPVSGLERMAAPQAPIAATLRSEAFPGGGAATELDLGSGMAAPQAPGPAVATDAP